MFAIYKRELRSYFNSFIGFLFIGATLFFLGLYYTVYNLMYGYPYYSYVISATSFLFLISVPILTMRVLSEERRNKTDQLTLTAPISVGAIVMGKYLALCTIFAIPTLISCIYPLILTMYGSIPMGSCYISILAFFLYGIACIAICEFISSVTESQVIAAVLSFAVLFLGYMMSSICSLISTTGNLLTRILSAFDMYTPFINLLEGTLNLDAVVYFITLSAFFLFLTVQSIQRRRYSVSVHKLSMGAYSTTMIVVMLAIVVVINYIFSAMPSSWTAIDLTSQKLYSLTDQTKEFVADMDEDVTMYVYVSESTADSTVDLTLRRYDELSDHITVEYVDPTVNPRFYADYTDSIGANDIIVVSDKRNTVIDYDDIYVSEISYDGYSYSSEITGYDAEGLITSAIAYVTTDEMPVMYITEGHDELSLETSFTNALERENVVYESVNLMDYETIPEDAACLLINAPLKDFNDDDLDKILDYLDEGGNVIVVVGASEENMPNFEEIVGYMGVSIVDGVVMETNLSNYYMIPYYLLPKISYSTYTSGIYNNYYIMAPYSRGLIIDDEEAEGFSYTTFLRTSDDAFSQVNTDNMDSFDKSDGDIDGPFVIGMEAVKEVETDDGTAQATMVIIGSEMLFTETSDTWVSGANLSLFTNITSAFCDHEVTISIPVKDYYVSALMIPMIQMIELAVTVTLILPIACLVVGFVIWFRRRKK